MNFKLVAANVSLVHERVISLMFALLLVGVACGAVQCMLWELSFVLSFLGQEGTKLKKKTFTFRLHI